MRVPERLRHRMSYSTVLSTPVIATDKRSPIRALVVQLSPAQSGQRIEPRITPRVGRRPFGAQPIPFLETVQRRIEGALLHLQDVLGDLLDPLRDGVAVDRAERNDLEDQDIERAPKQVGISCFITHTMTLYICICSLSRRHDMRRLAGSLVTPM